MDADLNVYGLASGRDESHIELELNIAPIDGSADGLAQLNICGRSGRGLSILYFARGFRGS